MPRKITVVISQAQGRNPAKRHLEEELAARLLMEPDIDCSLVPHLYDMSHDHTGLLFLRSVPGDVVVLSWLYPRAAFWTLDRAGVRGKWGTSLLKSEDDEDDEFPEDGPPPPTGRDANRTVYAIDLRGDSDPDVYVEELRRIAGETSVETVDLMSWINGDPSKELLERYLKPVESTPSNGANGSNGTTEPAITFDTTADPAKRRWYPVIDYDRCTNCMECIDFCLFGVYGVDNVDTILVEQQDSCKKGCPACSRVCPENAIIFPGHKEAAIAGADGDVGGLKIDLSKLFGGGQADDALDMAVAERDAELVADGRDAVGMAVGIPKRQPTTTGPRDELDDLVDGLDDLDL